MSTAGDHIAAAGAVSLPRPGRNVSSNSWFILSWIAESSLNGSTQRMIAMLPSLSDGPRGAGMRLPDRPGLLLRRVLVLGVDDLALLRLGFRAAASGRGRGRGGRRLLVHGFRKLVGAPHQLVPRGFKDRLVLGL